MAKPWRRPPSRMYTLCLKREKLGVLLEDAAHNKPFTCRIAPHSWDGRPSGRGLLQIAETDSGLSHKLRHAGKGNRKRYLDALCQILNVSTSHAWTVKLASDEAHRAFRVCTGSFNGRRTEAYWTLMYPVPMTELSN